MFKKELAIIVPTKDRPDDLNRFLQSLRRQEVKPTQIIIVDSGSKDLGDILNGFSNLQINYIKKNQPSLTFQRNVGIRMLKENASLVAFFDDDIALEENSLKNMMKFWENASEDVGGACFNNMSQPFKRPKFFEKIFIVNSELPGKMLPSGFQSIPCAVDRTMQIDWLIGCAMVFRKEIFREFLFDERFSGYARYEDVDFSYRVGKKFKIFVVADAKVKHFLKLERIEDSFALGKMEVINRLYFVKKNPNLSLFLCYWSLLGYFFNNSIKGLLGYDKRYKFRAKGNIYGFVEFVLKARLVTKK